MKEGMFFILVLVVLGFSCMRGTLVKDDVPIRALQVQGYRDPVVLEKHWFAPWFYGGAQEDAAVFKMQATNALGDTVVVYVSCGWPWKGSTIRSR